MDQFDIVERAEELLCVDENDEIYYTCLFVAMRSIGVSLREAVRITNRCLQGTRGKVRYRHIYELGIEHEYLLDRGFSVGPERILLSDPALLDAAEREFDTAILDAEKNVYILGNLGNMFWLEAALQVSNRVSDFNNSVEDIRKMYKKPENRKVQQ